MTFKRVTSHIIIGLLALVLANNVYAENKPIEFTLKHTSNGYKGVTASFKITTRYQVSNLLGDAVIQAQARFELGEHIYINNRHYSLSQIPKSVLKKTGIYDVKLSVPFPTLTGRQVYHDVDLGAFNGPGKKWSFNTPSSPEWSKFLYEGRYRYYDKPTAKSAYKDYMINKLFKTTERRYYQDLSKIISIKYDFNALLEWAKKTTTYSIYIDAEPPTATIKVNGKKLKYNSSLSLTEGSYKVSITDKGYETISTSIKVTKDQRFKFRLKKRKEGKKDPFAERLAKTEKSSKDPFADKLAKLENKDRSSLKPTEPTSKSLSLRERLAKADKAQLIIKEYPRSTRSNVVTIKGLIKNMSSIDSSKVKFYLNGMEQPVNLKRDGSFNNKIVLFNGDNHIKVSYLSSDGKISKNIVINSSTPPVKARFTLVWDSSGSDMDLHVKGPNGEHCSYNNKKTMNMRLDVDNTKAYGPENISVELNGRGRYKAFIKHYGGNSGRVTLYTYLDNRLVKTSSKYLSGNKQWTAYTLDID